MLAEIQRIGDSHHIQIGTFGHAGDGNLHPTILLNRDDPDNASKADAVRSDLYRAAIRLGGTITGEHGIGISRRPYLEEQRGPDAVRFMRAIKHAFDPMGILNPGRLL
jgi:glycolate oxidase